MKNCLELFVTFLKMGVLTFGGGYAMIPVVERELVNKKGWTNMDEVVDYYTIAQVTPGIIAVNLSTFIGYKRAGAFGGFLATLGFVLPGISFITVIAVFLTNFADLPVVQHAFTGIRVAICALVVDTVIKLVKGVFKNKKAVVMYIVAFALSAIWSVSPMLLVIGAGLLGLLLFRQKPDNSRPGNNVSAEPKGDGK
ncbi:MAG: chromate transporter [Treponema sp.]|jgi:chromate transporter|nr:chromate transporter [Treponema sp.]